MLEEKCFTLRFMPGQKDDGMTPEQAIPAPHSIREGNPRLDTFVKLCDAIGMQIHIIPVAKPAHTP